MMDASAIELDREAVFDSLLLFFLLSSSIFFNLIIFLLRKLRSFSKFFSASIYRAKSVLRQSRRRIKYSDSRRLETIACISFLCFTN